MKTIVCKNCGSQALTTKNGYLVCDYCGSKFAIEKDDAAVKASVIDIEDDVTRLLKKCEEDPLNARRYVNLILDIDPTNRNILKYIKGGY